MEQLKQPPFIDVVVRPITVAGIEFKRSQRYVGHFPEQNPVNGEMSVTVRVLVRHFLTDADGTLVDANQLMSNYFLTYRADNTEVVDLSTEQVVMNQDGKSVEEFDALIAADPRPLAKRGNAFGWQMHYPSAQSESDQIEAAMIAADTAPWYRFGV